MYLRGDISSKHIVGGNGYKKRSAKQVMRYIKNNPKRFGKEAAKVTAAATAIGYGAKTLYDYNKKQKTPKDSSDSKGSQK